MECHSDSGVLDPPADYAVLLIIGPPGSPQPPHRTQNRGRLVAQVTGVAESAASVRGSVGDEAEEITDGVGGGEYDHVIAGIRP